MTLTTFHNKKYATWNVDLSFLRNTSLDQELETAYQNELIFDAPERIGEGKSIKPKVFKNFDCFQEVYKFVTNEITKQFDYLHIPVYYRRLNLKRCWSNRLYKNTLGTIHNHPNSTVFLIYYNIPENSSNIVFIDSKHNDKFGFSEETIPAEDKFSIPVHTGLCLLHDGNILHAISKHNSDIPRDVLVFEFESIFR